MGLSYIAKPLCYAFRGKEAWFPLHHTMPLNFSSAKSWVPALFSEVSFVSVLAMVLSEYWKRLEENFRKKLFLRFPKNDENYKKKPLALFNILKEPLLVQKQTIHQRKALDLSFNLKPQKWAWHYQEGATPTRREKHILLNFMGAEGFWLLVFYEISRTPFLSYSHF